MNKRIILGITGKAGSGKDTVANYLVRNHNFVKLHFADPLKDICRKLFRFSEEQLDGSAKENIDPRYGQSPRWIMQQVGTFFRNIYPSVWIDYLTHKIESLDNGTAALRIVVADVRYLNETTALLRFPDMSLIRIICPDNPKVLPVGCDEHSSETEQDEIRVKMNFMARYGDTAGLINSVKHWLSV